VSGAPAALLTREQAPWLQSGPLARLLAILDADGEEARVVGGAVRNTLLGLPPGDIDLATTAQPNEVVRRARAAGLHPVPTGIEHGTVTVVVEGKPFEVTTLRQDIETFGRRAVVRFGRDWRADAERRDFTINALSLARDGTVLDPVGGLADIEGRRVRFIGDPAKRIAEDYLRALRFFRFFAAYAEGPPDPAGLSACIRARDELARLSRERVRIEMLKLMPALRASETAAIMTDSGILDRVLGGVPDLAALARLVEIERALALEPGPLRRLGALAVRIEEDAARMRDRLRLSNDEYRRLGAAAQARHIAAGLPEADARELLYRVGPDDYRDRVLVAFARSGAEVGDQAWRSLVSLPSRWSPPIFPLAAKDFLARGMAKGPPLGRALLAAEQAWIAAGFPGDAAEIAAIADAAVSAVSEKKPGLT
jgi:poly(A) polymerase